MTTPSIRETLLTLICDHAAETTDANDKASRLRDELDQLPDPAGFPLVRAFLTAQIAEADTAARGATDRVILHAALVLGLRTAKGGECNIDKPPLYPVGPPTKAENAARGTKDPEPPADQPPPTTTPETPTTGAGADVGDGSSVVDARRIDDSPTGESDAATLPPGFVAFAKAIADQPAATARSRYMSTPPEDRTLAAANLVLIDRGWAWDELAAYGDAVIFRMAELNLGPSDVTRATPGVIEVDATGEVIT